jgi:hypothetical protein
MAVVSVYIYYPSGVPGVGSAYDLRRICTARREGSEAVVQVVGIVDAPIRFPDWAGFFAAWVNAVSPAPPGYDEFRVLDPTGTFHEDYNVVTPPGTSHEQYFVKEP